MTQISPGDYLKQQSDKYGLPIEVPLSIIYVESKGNSTAINGNAVGIFQITPSYPGAQNASVAQREDPYWSIDTVLPILAAAYHKGQQLGYSGAQLEDFVASHSGFDAFLPLSDPSLSGSGNVQESSGYFPVLNQSYSTFTVTGGGSSFSASDFLQKVGSNLTDPMQHLPGFSNPILSPSDIAGAVSSGLAQPLVQGEASIAKAIGNAILPWIILLTAFVIVLVLFLKSMQGEGDAPTQYAPSSPSSIPASPYTTSVSPAPGRGSMVRSPKTRLGSPGAIDADFYVVG